MFKYVRLFYILVIFLILEQINSRYNYPVKCEESDKREDIMCTMEYIGVCGWKKNSNCTGIECGVESSNPCTACGIEGVDYVTEGKCNIKTDDEKTNENLKYTFCKDGYRNSTCEANNNSTDTVCAYYSKDCNNSTCRQNVLKCNACLDEKVLYFTETCDSGILKYYFISNIFVLLFFLIV